MGCYEAVEVGHLGKRLNGGHFILADVDFDQISKFAQGPEVNNVVIGKVDFLQIGKMSEHGVKYLDFRRLKFEVDDVEGVHFEEILFFLLNFLVIVRCILVQIVQYEFIVIEIEGRVIFRKTVLYVLQIIFFQDFLFVNDEQFNHIVLLAFLKNVVLENYVGEDLGWSSTRSDFKKDKSIELTHKDVFVFLLLAVDTQKVVDLTSRNRW